MHHVFPITEDDCMGGRLGETCNRNQGIDSEPMNRLGLIARVQALVDAASLANVLADPCQIEQVVINLGSMRATRSPGAGI